MMKRKLFNVFIIGLMILAFSSLQQQCLSSSYIVSYYLLDKPNGSKQYKLNVAIPQSLYEYYREKDHKQVSVEDFSKFVTPYPVKPVADKLWQIYSNMEDFANGVLMIVHQIPYTFSTAAKYPVETILENDGDCDLFSYIAVSVMKAGGLDVVLLYYEKQAHMNVGVHLPNPPRYARTSPYYVTYNGVRYYMAECTGENWKDGWRVGECPPDLRQATPQIVSVEKCEEWAPGQVSASYKALQPSTLSLTASSTFTFQGSTVQLTGQLIPKLQNQPVTIYVKVGSSSWKTLAIAETDNDGKFAWTWTVNETATCQLRASWSGYDDYTGADSLIVTVTVIPTFFLTLIAVAAFSICIGVVAITLFGKKGSTVDEVKIPEVPS